MKQFICIGLSGKICSGKTVLADMLLKKYTGFRASLAEEVKATTDYLFGKTTRELLQGVGTKLRDVDEDIWVNKLLKNVDGIKHYSDHKRISETVGEHPLIIVDDVRFKNEKQALEKDGWIVIRIVVSKYYQKNRSRRRDDIDLTDDVLNHPSETDLDAAEFEYYIDGNKDINTCFGDIVKIIDEATHG